MADIGENVVQGIFEQLKIDDMWSRPIRRGFEWWGHRLRQRIWATPGFEDNGIEIFRIFIVTDTVRDISAPNTAVEGALGPLGSMAIGSAIVFTPNNHTLKLWSSATVHENVAGWMTRLLSSYAIIQLIEAEARAEQLAKLTSGNIDMSPHPSSGERSEPDEMLSVMDTVFRPMGQRPSPWNGNQEINQIREILNSNNCFSMGDENGLTAEFPFGDATSMLRIITDEPHPAIGSGVGLFLHIPLWGTVSEASSIANALNRAEADRQTVGHLLGSWCSKTIGERSLPAFAFFIPTALHQPGLLMNLAFSMFGRAHWIGSLMNPDTPPGDVLDIITRRFQQIAEP